MKDAMFKNEYAKAFVARTPEGEAVGLCLVGALPRVTS